MAGSSNAAAGASPWVTRSAGRWPGATTSGWAVYSATPTPGSTLSTDVEVLDLEGRAAPRLDGWRCAAAGWPSTSAGPRTCPSPTGGAARRSGCSRRSIMLLGLPACRRRWVSCCAFAPSAAASPRRRPATRCWWRCGGRGPSPTCSGRHLGRSSPTTASTTRGPRSDAGSSATWSTLRSLRRATPSCSQRRPDHPLVSTDLPWSASGGFASGLRLSWPRRAAGSSMGSRGWLGPGVARAWRPGRVTGGLLCEVDAWAVEGVEVPGWSGRWGAAGGSAGDLGPAVGAALGQQDVVSSAGGGSGPAEDAGWQVGTGAGGVLELHQLPVALGAVEEQGERLDPAAEPEDHGGVHQSGRVLLEGDCQWASGGGRRVSRGGVREGVPERPQAVVGESREVRRWPQARADLEDGDADGHGGRPWRWQPQTGPPAYEVSLVRFPVIEVRLEDACVGWQRRLPQDDEMASSEGPLTVGCAPISRVGPRLVRP